ncbi:MAG TPA: glycine betaine ABC transporter substrate-binding protein, partial [Candidatus Limnocylindrales bacterium]|nr:glycine betaine ABC transporter substrate-binding protein [Candidatus Limnocylindrales bacterium]
MRLSRALALGASLLVLFSACSTGGGSKPTIKIGSDGFDEARVIAEVYAQVLEADGYTVDRAGIGLGARKVTAAALESGQIDLKPEYIGSGLVYYGGAATNDPAKNQADLQAKLTSVGGGITVFAYTPGQDTNALVVT